MNRSASRILIGLVVVAIGVAFLFNTMGWIEIHTDTVWQLWPVLIIAIGVAMLPRKGWISWLIGVIAIVATMIIVGLMFFGGTFEIRDVEVQEFSQQKELGIESGVVRIQTGAGKLIVRGKEQDELVSGKVRSNVASLDVEQNIENDTQHVTLRSSTERALWFTPSTVHSLEVNLVDDTPLTFDIDSGAMDMEVDLRQVLLDRSTINIGASSLNLFLGGDTSSEVTINAGASSIAVDVPQDSGVRISIDSGISSRDFPGFQQVSENVYESLGFEEAEHRILLHLKVGASSVRVNRR